MTINQNINYGNFRILTYHLNLPFSIERIFLKGDTLYRKIINFSL